jgi:DNA-binding beta-propeller fold protein YncE
VWVANQFDATVSRVLPTTGRTIATIPLDRGAIWPGAILSTAAGIWVVAQDGMVVNRIRPQDATVDLRIPIPYARTLAAALGSVWVGVANSTSLIRITHGKAAPVAVPGRRANGYGPRLAGGSALWLAVPGSVVRVRPVDGRQLSFRLPAGHHLSAIVEAGDVWVADQSAERIVRLADAGPGRTP